MGENLLQADGHCMYRAVQDQLEAGEEDPGLDYQELRQETASYMRAFPDNFLPFINQVSCFILHLEFARQLSLALAVSI